MLQAYAVQRNYDIRHLKVSADTQGQLTEKFEQDARAFFEGKEFVPFNEGWKTDDHELFRIEGFRLPDGIKGCVESADGCQDMSAEELDEGNIRAVFAASARAGGSVEKAIFKRIDSSKVYNRNKLDLRYDLGYDRDTLTRSQTPGLIVPDSVAAVYRENSLYFSARQTAGQVLDLTDYFVEATDADIESFLNEGPLAFQSVDQVKNLADSWSRRRIRMIAAQPIWNQVQVSQICEWASGVNVEIETALDRNGETVIKVPEERVGFKNLLRLLNEDFFEAPFSGRRFLSNSKRPAI